MDLNNINSLVYRLFLDDKTYQILLNDLELFKFKSMNSLLNKIISNYYESYNKAHNTFNDIKEIIQSISDVSNEIANQKVNQIYEAIYGPNKTVEKHINPLTIRPNKDSLSTFLLINEFLNESNHSTLGLFIKNMLVDYAKLNRIEREKIVFKHIFSIFNIAKKDSFCLSIKTETRNAIYYPGLIMEPLDDFGSYMLVVDITTKKTHALLIRKIEKINLNQKYKKRDLLNISFTKYKYKELLGFTKKEYSTLQKILSIDSLEKIYNALPLIEKLTNQKFEKASEKQLLFALPKIRDQQSELSEEELNDLITKKHLVR